jgi:hypothetical protein
VRRKGPAEWAVTLLLGIPFVVLLVGLARTIPRNWKLDPRGYRRESEQGRTLHDVSGFCIETAAIARTNVEYDPAARLGTHP